LAQPETESSCSVFRVEFDLEWFNKQRPLLLGEAVVESAFFQKGVRSRDCHQLEDFEFFGSAYASLYEAAADPHSLEFGMDREALNFGQLAGINFDGRKADRFPPPAGNKGMLEQVLQFIPGSRQQEFLVDKGLEESADSPEVFFRGVEQLDICGGRLLFHSVTAPGLNHLLVEVGASSQLLKGNPFVVGVGLFDTTGATNDFFRKFRQQPAIGCI
jgi:hypothetical protein